MSNEEIEQIAFDSGFFKRKSGKIQAPDFLLYFCLQSLDGTVSYNDLASKIEAQTGVNVSRQAYHQRMGEECNAFFMKILETVLLPKNQHEAIGPLITSKTYKRILVQDSTIIRLPLRLFDIFSGVKNAHSAVCNARIQGVYDLISRKFIKFSIDSYSKNDLSVTLDIPVEKGDLILRDRGYFTIDAMKKLKNKGVDSIFRYKYKTSFFDINNKNEIDLLDILKKEGSIDQEVLAGVKEKYKVRIVAVPATEEVGNIRRMKAKKESKSKKTPSKEYLELMSWSIFVITIKTKEVTFEMIFRLYELRWRIENIFKTWKSNFNFDKIHNVSEQQLGVLLRARLIMIVVLNHYIFNPLSHIIMKNSDKKLSMMKFMHYISINKNVIIKVLDLKNISNKTIQALIKYCTYDKRNRKNFEEKEREAILKLNNIAVI